VVKKNLDLKGVPGGFDGQVEQQALIFADNAFVFDLRISASITSASICGKCIPLCYIGGGASPLCGEKKSIVRATR
jgi:hypothetical protein